MNWLYKISDAGLPIPLLRHKGKPDLMASLVVLCAVLLSMIILFGGSTFDYNGLHLKIPTLSSLSEALPAIGALITSVIGYCWRRGQDINANGCNK